MVHIALFLADTNPEANVTETNQKEDLISKPESEEISERVYLFLHKEMEKSKPNEEVLNFYLTKDLQNRRNFIKHLPSKSSKERVEKILKKYPIFKENSTQVNIQSFKPDDGSYVQNS